MGTGGITNLVGSLVECLSVDVPKFQGGGSSKINGIIGTGDDITGISGRRQNNITCVVSPYGQVGKSGCLNCSACGSSQSQVS